MALSSGYIYVAECAKLRPVIVPYWMVVMDLLARIDQHFAASLAAKQRTLEEMGTRIAQVAERLAEQLRRGNKILICGNGGSAADAQHFAAELVNRF
ncbi:MAG TPA: SIS domain-containing protein, partial [Candidatus Competibacter sp.]|nr:SIS domain-containing protein [Candidatus Competibacter sp.]